jgi:hypothetical protein
MTSNRKTKTKTKCSIIKITFSFFFYKVEEKLEQEKVVPPEKLDLALRGETMKGKAKWKKIKCVIKFCKLGSQKQVTIAHNNV